jgi:hypothetical protein
MKPEAITAHRTLLCVLIGLFEALLVVSIWALWFIDPRRISALSDAAGITAGFSFVGLLGLWWLLRRGAPRLASICLMSALVGLVCSMILPAVP